VGGSAVSGGGCCVRGIAVTDGGDFVRWGVLFEGHCCDRWGVPCPGAVTGGCVTCTLALETGVHLQPVFMVIRDRGAFGNSMCECGIIIITSPVVEN
jgi:hypothetical protein